MLKRHLYLFCDLVVIILLYWLLLFLLNSNHIYQLFYYNFVVKVLIFHSKKISTQTFEVKRKRGSQYLTHAIILVKRDGYPESLKNMQCTLMVDNKIQEKLRAYLSVLIGY